MCRVGGVSWGGYFWCMSYLLHCYGLLQQFLYYFCEFGFSFPVQVKSVPGGSWNLPGLHFEYLGVAKLWMDFSLAASG